MLHYERLCTLALFLLFSAQSTWPTTRVANLGRPIHLSEFAQVFQQQRCFPPGATVVVCAQEQAAWAKHMCNDYLPQSNQPKGRGYRVLPVRSAK
eukprot:1138372-Pelagomonas_calceolata.AAC.2